MISFETTNVVERRHFSIDMAVKKRFLVGKFMEISLLNLVDLKNDFLKREHARIERLNAIEALSLEAVAIKQEASAGGLMMIFAIARIDICSGGDGMPDRLAWREEYEDRQGFAKHDGVWRFPTSYIDKPIHHGEFFPIRSFRECIELISKALGFRGEEGINALNALQSCFDFTRDGDFRPLAQIFDRIPVHAVQSLLIHGSGLGALLGATDVKGYLSAIFDWFEARGIDPLAYNPVVVAHYERAKVLFDDDEDEPEDLATYVARNFSFLDPEKVRMEALSGDIAMLTEVTRRKLLKGPPSPAAFHVALMEQSLDYVVELIAAGADPNSKTVNDNNAYHSVASRWSTGREEGYELIQLLAEKGVRAEPNAKGLYPYYAMSMRDTWRDKEKFQKARDLVVELQELAKPSEKEAEPTPLKKPAFFSLLRGKGETL
jgi:hypothetical protein